MIPAYLHAYVPLSVISLDALRAGFERAWREKDDAMIARAGTRVPEDLLQRDDKVLR